MIWSSCVVLNSCGIQQASTLFGKRRTRMWRPRRTLWRLRLGNARIRIFMDAFFTYRRDLMPSIDLYTYSKVYITEIECFWNGFKHTWNPNETGSKWMFGETIISYVKICSFQLDDSKSLHREIILSPNIHFKLVLLSSRHVLFVLKVLSVKTARSRRRATSIRLVFPRQGTCDTFWELQKPHPFFVWNVSVPIGSIGLVYLPKNQPFM